MARADAEPDEAPNTEQDEEPAAEQDEFRFSVVTRRAGSMSGAMIATVVSAALARHADSVALEAPNCQAWSAGGSSRERRDCGRAG